MAVVVVDEGMPSCIVEGVRVCDEDGVCSGGNGVEEEEEEVDPGVSGSKN